MTSVAEEVKTFMEDYKAADKTIKNAMREYAFFELFKWEAIRDKILKTDMEASE